MKITPSRIVLFLSSALVFFTTFSGLCGNLLTNNNEFKELLDSYHIDMKILFLGIVVSGVALIILTLLQLKHARESKSSTDADLSNPETGSDVARIFDDLKKRYQDRRIQKLDDRFELVLRVKASWKDQNQRKAAKKFDIESDDIDALYYVRKAFSDDERIMILGNPGIGKTVILLRLATDFLNESDQGGKAPFPVVFNLISWSEKYETLEEWLAEMLVSSNGVSPALAKNLIDEDRIIPFFDGLDELGRGENKEATAALRSHCIRSLSQYLRRGRRAIICCQCKEYFRIRKMIAADTAGIRNILLGDLTNDQVESALIEATSRVDSKGNKIDKVAATHLKDILQQNLRFFDVLRVPFFFNACLQVFDGPPVETESLPKDTDQLEKFLIEKFVVKNFSPGKNQENVLLGSAFRWLGWLAKLMEKRKRGAFQLSDLQPTDLKNRRLYSFVVESIFGLFMGLGVWITTSIGINLGTGLSESLTRCLLAGFAIGLIRGLTVALRMGLKRGLMFGLTVGLSGGLIFGLLIGSGLHYLSVLVGLLFGVIGAFSDVLEISINIRTDDVVYLDWRKLLSLEFWMRTMAHVLVVFLLVVITVGSIVGPKAGLITGLVSGLVMAVTGGFEMIKSTESYVDIRKPHQRIYGGFWLNFAFYWILNLLFGAGLYLLPSLKLEADIEKILVSFLVGAFLVYAHLAFFTPLLKHIALRLILFYEGSAPLKYAKFLNYAAGLRILERDGGFWRFRHQNLQEYFSKLEI